MRQIRHTRVLFVFTIVMMISTACGGSDDADDASINGGSDSNTTNQSDGSDTGATSGDDGDGGSDAASGEGPRDYPLAVPAGDFRDVHVEVGIPQESLGQLLYPDDDFDRVVAFYEAWVADQPGEWARVDLTNQIAFTNTQGTETVSIEKGYEYQDQMYTSVGYGGFTDG